MEEMVVLFLPFIIYCNYLCLQISVDNVNMNSL